MFQKLDIVIVILLVMLVGFLSGCFGFYKGFVSFRDDVVQGNTMLFDGKIYECVSREVDRHEDD